MMFGAIRLLVLACVAWTCAHADPMCSIDAKFVSRTDKEVKVEYTFNFKPGAEYTVPGIIEGRMSTTGVSGGVSKTVTYICKDGKPTSHTVVMYKIVKKGTTEEQEECAKKAITIRCKKDGSVVMDPHFRTFAGDRYDYHGECELVLLHNPGYKQGMGMDIHIRTKIRSFYSYVETAVVRIGAETFEVTAGDQSHFRLNGEKNVALPARMAGHPVGYRYIDATRGKYNIILGDEAGQIHISTYKHFVSVSVKDTTSDAYAGSLGLMGKYETGQKVARDGVTVLEDPNEFGQEWQVLPTDPKLFHDVAGPQYPEKCILPTLSAQQQRQLRGAGEGITYEQARNACSRVPLDSLDICVFDVLATNDLDIAGAY